MTVDDADRLIEAIRRWAETRTDIVAMALVGSWARGKARSESDLDLMLLVETPAAYRVATGWLSEIDWRAAGFAVERFADAQYGTAWSRHVDLAPSAEVELAFADPGWAATDPVDNGTADVLAGGGRIVLDPRGVLSRLLDRIGEP